MLSLSLSQTVPYHLSITLNAQTLQTTKHTHTLSTHSLRPDIYEKMNGLIEIISSTKTSTCGQPHMLLIGFSDKLISTCPVCLKSKVHVIHLKPCGHILCKQCMFEIYFKPGIRKLKLCPICRHSSIPQLPNDL
jgi:hypothetical protein